MDGGSQRKSLVNSLQLASIQETGERGIPVEGPSPPPVSLGEGETLGRDPMLSQAQQAVKKLDTPVDLSGKGNTSGWSAPKADVSNLVSELDEEETVAYTHAPLVAHVSQLLDFKPEAQGLDEK